MASCKGSGHWANPSPYGNLWECPFYHTVGCLSLAVVSDRRTGGLSPGQPFRGQDSAVHRVDLIRVWRGLARGLCLQVATCGGVPVPVPRGVQLTSLPGDGFQVAGASRQLAGVEPQAAAAVGRFLAGPGLDAWAGVLQGEGERWLRCQCPALPSPDLGPPPRHGRIIVLCSHC